MGQWRSWLVGCWALSGSNQGTVSKFAGNHFSRQTTTATNTIVINSVFLSTNMVYNTFGVKCSKTDDRRVGHKSWQPGGNIENIQLEV